jgi:glycosyltransferase involved in cell wall biosynthesis
VVASDQSGFRPFVNPETGALVPEERPDRLAEETVRVLRAGLGRFEAGLDAVARRFSWESYADSVEEFTDSLH